MDLGVIIWYFKCYISPGSQTLPYLPSAQVSLFSARILECSASEIKTVEFP